MDDHLNCVVFINIEYLISKISCINTLLQEIDTLIMLIAVAIAILLLWYSSIFKNLLWLSPGYIVTSESA